MCRDMSMHILYTALFQSSSVGVGGGGQRNKTKPGREGLRPALGVHEHLVAGVPLSSWGAGREVPFGWDIGSTILGGWSELDRQRQEEGERGTGKSDALSAGT